MGDRHGKLPPSKSKLAYTKDFHSSEAHWPLITAIEMLSLWLLYMRASPQAQSPWQSLGMQPTFSYASPSARGLGHWIWALGLLLTLVGPRATARLEAPNTQPALPIFPPLVPSCTDAPTMPSQKAAFSHNPGQSKSSPLLGGWI